MKTLNISRWVLASLLICLSVFYIFLSTGTQTILPYLQGRMKSEFSLTGDYNSLITVKDTAIQLQESIHFTKSTLDTFVRSQFAKKNMVGVKRWSKSADQGSNVVDSLDFFQSLRNSYITSLVNRGWIHIQSSADDYLLKRERNIPYKLGLLVKTKVISVPLLFTAKNTDSVTKANINKAVARFVSPAAVNYILSPASVISMVAPKGSILETFPDAKRQNMLDKDDSELFRFMPTDINGDTYSADARPSSVINMKILNPYFNNIIGRMVADWSIAKILTWTITALIALFADKLKKMLLEPVVDRLFTSFKPKKTPKRANRSK